jgi:pimeloyl-ACP methyl ester carboxylesterase
MINLVHKALDKKNLIIFIHGFIGGEETWIKKDGTRPLIDYLIADQEIWKNFNIALFQYHSKLLTFFPHSTAAFNFWKKKKNPINLPIIELSKLLETKIQYTCAEYENIILIGHSMGGLVAKRFILDDLRKNTDSKVKLYVSLATPHSGSVIANFGTSLINNVQTKDLAALSESITLMNNEWIQNKNLPRRIYGQGMYDTIVSKESSIALDAVSQSVIYSDDDHFSIILPKEKNIIVDALILELNNFLKEQKIKSIENHEQFSDEGQFDEEIFVLKLIMADIHSTLLSGSKLAFYNAEFTVRKLNSLGVDLNTLEPLYTKIQELYFIEFGELINGTHKNPNELLTAVHKKIKEQDKKDLISMHDALKSLQKFGMLQQLAGKYNSIWWDKTHDENNFEEFKKALNKK